jgi:hypothetical protein
LLELNQKKDLQKKQEQLIEDLSKHLELDKEYIDKFDYKLMCSPCIKQIDPQINEGQ